jgi:hypothetical protein
LAPAALDRLYRRRQYDERALRSCRVKRVTASSVPAK